MSNLNQLVKPECGSSNALVALSQQFQRQPFSIDIVQRHGASSSHSNEFAQEFLYDVGKNQVPTAFRMTDILTEVNRAYPVGPSVVDNRLAASWAHQFERDKPQLNNSLNNHSQWRNEFHRGNESTMYSRQNVMPVPALESVWNQANNSSKWSVEYLEEVESKSNLTEAASGIPHDPELWNTEFMQHMQREYGVESPFASEAIDEDLDYAWSSAKASAEAANSNTFESEFWDSLGSKWDDAMGDNGNNFMTQTMYQKYSFQEDNPYSEVGNSLEKGKDCLARGDLANAVLFFEAAVNQQSESAEAWQFLGIAQAENEQEPSAISALRRCVSLDPNNLTALLNLAVSLTNESLYSDGCKSLRQWLMSNPKYNSMFHGASSDGATSQNSRMTFSFLDFGEFREIETLLLKAVNSTSPSQIDPELQNALGILYNMSGDYTKAVECFQLAVQLEPDNARLWNRLGATLANSSRSAEALPAYNRALGLYPGYVRARYNLGICCMNLSAHKEAVDHFMSALSLQLRGIGPLSSKQMSDSIWTSLRMALLSTNEKFATSFLDNQDFDSLASYLNWKPHSEQQ